MPRQQKLGCISQFSDYIEEQTTCIQLEHKLEFLKKVKDVAQDYILQSRSKQTVLHLLYIIEKFFEKEGLKPSDNFDGPVILEIDSLSVEAPAYSLVSRDKRLGFDVICANQQICQEIIGIDLDDAMQKVNASNATIYDILEALQPYVNLLVGLDIIKDRGADSSVIVDDDPDLDRAITNLKELLQQRIGYWTLDGFDEEMLKDSLTKALLNNDSDILNEEEMFFHYDDYSLEIARDKTTYLLSDLFCSDACMSTLHDLSKTIFKNKTRQKI